MAPGRKCQVCGVELGPDVPEGVCPACALRAAILPATQDPAGLDSAASAQVLVHYFGDYELLREIGRGGMGVVYLARQVSLNRRVALKLIQAGRLAGEAEVTRFRREAEAAARLQHPNIVAVHEAGECDGQHYYSMDLVDGRSLGDLVDQQPMPARQAARYMRIVADAVQYAHDQGTRHRDLKPRNILIDGRDQPRVIDFGLARCERFDPHLTKTGQPVGTPAFMSPEQAQGKGKAIGPEGDVYSIGAVLYSLLTGLPPFTAESMADLLDSVRFREPVPPRALNPSVPRDLDTICLKCLEKDPTRRYRSAQDLSDELARFIRGEPVLAHPPGLPGRTWRWCGRNRRLAAAIATAVFVLVAGTAVSIWQAVRANAEAAEKKQIAAFLQTMLKGVGPSVARGRDTKLLRDLLDDAAERIGKELKGLPVAEAELRTTIGDVYLELAEYSKADAMFREALRLARQVHGRNRAEIASALDRVSQVLYHQGKATEAEALERKVLAMRTKALGQDHPTVAESLINLAAYLRGAGKLPEAESVSRQAIAANRKAHGPGHEDVIAALDILECVFCDEGKLPEAEGTAREVLALARKAHGSTHPGTATSLHNLGKILADEHKTAEAEAALREALDLRKKVLGDQHPDVAQTLDTLAGLIQDRGNLAEAETMYRKALAVRKKALGNEHPEVALSLNNLADLLDDEGKTAEAETVQREALAIQKKLLGAEHPDVARSLCNLARLLQTQGKPAEAEPMLQEAAATQRRLLGNDDPALATSLEEFASVLLDEDKLDAAETASRECLSIREKTLPNDWLTFSTRSALGGILLARKKYAEAEPFLLSGYNGLNARRAEIPAAGKPRLKSAIDRLIRLYSETQQPEKAAEWRLKR